MPVQNSGFNDFSDVRLVGNFAILPLRTKFRGPAYPTGDYDIVDEVIDLFRVNSFFRNFEFKGNADRTLIYGILFLNECLARLKTEHTPNEANKVLNTIATNHFALPGEPTFPLNALYSAPRDASDADLLKTYLSQFRQELALRLVQHVYGQEQQPSKHWLAFSRKRFMNLSLVK